MCPEPGDTSKEATRRAQKREIDQGLGVGDRLARNAPRVMSPWQQATALSLSLYWRRAARRQTTSYHGRGLQAQLAAMGATMVGSVGKNTTDLVIVGGDAPFHHQRQEEADVLCRQGSSGLRSARSYQV